jgi:hypothetical protein
MLNSVVKGDFVILVVNGAMKSKTVLTEYSCSDITKNKTKQKIYIYKK